MGNFEPIENRLGKQRMPKKHIRSVLHGSVGEDAENSPSDLRLIGIALKEAGLLTPGTDPKSLNMVIASTINHVSKSIQARNLSVPSESKMKPADHNERRMRRALSEMRYPVSHRRVLHSVTPKGVREALNDGLTIARNKMRTAQQNHSDETSPTIRRAVLPAISLQAFQANRRIAETLVHHSLDGLDDLIAESIMLNGKQGFVDVRDFLSVLKAKDSAKAIDLIANVKRRLRGKPRRRFIKLGRDMTPTEDDFDG